MLLTNGVVEARNPHGNLLSFDGARELSRHPAEEIAQNTQLFGREDDITVLRPGLSAAPEFAQR